MKIPFNLGKFRSIKENSGKFMSIKVKVCYVK